jgi:hypothetical protein
MDLLQKKSAMGAAIAMARIAVVTRLRVFMVDAFRGGSMPASNNAGTQFAG